MIAPKNPPKNPTMGQVDESVREAGERQAHAEATGAYRQPPLPPIFESREPDREARRETQGLGAAADEQAQVQAQPGPLALLSKIASMPWYAWLGVGALGLLVVSIVQEERAASSNPEDEEDLGDEDDEDEFSVEPDEDDDDLDEDLDEDLEGESEDDDSEDDEEVFDDESDESSHERDRVRRWARAGSRPLRRERVVEDNQPEQEPEESVLG